MLGRARPARLSAQDAPAIRRRYRPVWRGALGEILLLLIFTGVLQIAARLTTTFDPPLTIRNAVNVALALLPLGSWAFFSLWAERRVQSPRPALVRVLVLTLLLGNGVGIPLIDRLFAGNEWLVNIGGAQRIIGYALTSGMIGEFVKLLAIRFGAWDAIESRRDGVAYSFAAAAGYTTVLAVNYALSTPTIPISPEIMILRVTGFALAQMGIGTICGYALADLRIGQPFVVWLPVGLGIAALLQGLLVGVRAGLVIAGITVTGTASQTASGLSGTVVLTLILFIIVAFLIGTTDSRESTTSGEATP